jgi:thymidine kinase
MSLSVFTGCQASSKTTRNISDATKWLDVLHCKGVYINHINDTRDEANIISSNSSSYKGVSDKFTILSVPNLTDILDELDNYNVICIDEIQFFPDIVPVCKYLLDNGKHIFCSGLNTDWKGNDFGDVKNLLKYATTFEVLHAKCMHCVEEYKEKGIHNLHQIPDASRTGKISGTNEVIEIGGVDKYIPLCYKHHTLLLKKVMC